MRILFLTTLILLWGVVVNAIPIYPPMVGSQHQFHFKPGPIEYDADGIALTPATGSIGIVPEGGSQPIACLVITDQNAEYDLFVTIPLTGERTVWKAVGWPLGDDTCNGEIFSTPSVDTAYICAGCSGPAPILLSIPAAPPE